MKHQNVLWKQILGGVFIALALVVYALLFLDQQPKLKNFQAQLQHVQPVMVKTAAQFTVAAKALNWPSILLLFVGIAWVLNARKIAGVWCCRILMVYSFAFAALFFTLSFVAIKPVQSQFAQQWQTIAAGFGFLLVGIVCYSISKKLTKQSKETAAGAEPAKQAEPSFVPRKISASKSPSSFNSCNVLQLGGAARQLWHFESRSGQLVLQREQPIAAGQPLPSHLVAKTWRTLWQKRLNIGWLPPEKVFLRALQLPKVDFAETLSMVEFQLEKLSPLPVAQIAWSVHVLPQTHVAPAAEGQPDPPQTQTIIVTIVSRNLVEEFLGSLEQEGFLADRLEVPMLDNLATTRVAGDGAWVYADAANPNSALVAWWYGGALQSLGLVNAAPGEQRADSLREQFTQMAWAGELEGWLTSTPRWHLIADAAHAADWQAVLQKALDQPVATEAPKNLPELAAATARRAAQSDPNSNLLPQEFALRYKQQFVDRLWMRGIGAVLGVYVIGVLIYFGALQVLSYRTSGMEDKVAGLSQDYTNARQIKLRYEVLKDREELKFAALECWKATAELLPSEATLQSLDFLDGKKLSLRGTAPADTYADLLNFNTAMAKVTVDGKPLFNKVDSPGWRKDATGNTASWDFVCELKHTEER